MTMFDLLSIVGILLVVAVVSLLFGENPMFRIAEHIVVGAMGGHFVVMGYMYIRDQSFKPLLGGGVLYLIPMILGIMMFGRLTKWPWIVRYPLAVMTSTGLALSVRSGIQGQIFSPIIGMILPITAKNILGSVGNIISIALCLATLTYFVYTVKPTRHIKGAIRLGRLVMMGAFGAGVSYYMGTCYGYLVSMMTALRDYLLKVFLG